MDNIKCNETKHNETKHNETKHNGAKHNGTKQQDSNDATNNVKTPVKLKINRRRRKLKLRSKSPQQIKFIDLFAGTGAFTFAFEKNKRFQCIFANDMVKHSQAIYELNHDKSHFVLSDLNTIDVSQIPQHNLLCGGFPCQPFSIAGNKQGFNDTRSNVFWKIIQILKTHTPEYIVLENVKNLKTHDKGQTYNIIESNLQSIGYHIKTAILDTNKITQIPQHRERIYIVGFRDKKKYDKFNFDFPIQEQGKITDLLESDIADKYYYSNRYKVYDTIKNGVIKDISENVLYQYRRYYVRENKNGCCPTLTANMGSGGHNVPLLKDKKGIRKLTPRECFNLQGFPANYKLPDLSDGSLYKLAGNAVSVPVVQLIVEKLASVI